MTSSRRRSGLFVIYPRLDDGAVWWTVRRWYRLPHGAKARVSVTSSHWRAVRPMIRYTGQLARGEIQS